jgi:hypothetical protein
MMMSVEVRGAGTLRLRACCACKGRCQTLLYVQMAPEVQAKHWVKMGVAMLTQLDT